MAIYIICYSTYMAFDWCFVYDARVLDLDKLRRQNWWWATNILHTYLAVGASSCIKYNSYPDKYISNASSLYREYMAHKIMYVFFSISLNIELYTRTIKKTWIILDILKSFWQNCFLKISNHFKEIRWSDILISQIFKPPGFISPSSVKH